MALDGTVEAIADNKTGRVLVKMKAGVPFNEAKARDDLDVDNYTLKTVKKLP